MSWFYLGMAGLMEVAGVMLLKQTAGPVKYRAALWLLLSAVLIASFYLLSLSVHEIAIGTAYAVWTGIGSVGSVIVGIVWFDEPSERRRMLYLAAVIAGIIGLRLTS